jgi:hypothetical protein
LFSSCCISFHDLPRAPVELFLITILWAVFPHWPSFFHAAFLAFNTRWKGLLLEVFYLCYICKQAYKKHSGAIK